MSESKNQSDNGTSNIDLKLHDKDTGSSSVQIVKLTKRIIRLTDHMISNKKDVSTKRGLLRLVSRRRNLLDYLKRTKFDKYKEVISTLGLRK